MVPRRTCSRSARQGARQFDVVVVALALSKFWYALLLCFVIAKVSLVPLRLDGATWGPNRASFPDPSAPYIPKLMEAPGQAPVAVAPLLEALFKVKAVEHSREYADAFFEKLLGLLSIRAQEIEARGAAAEGEVQQVCEVRKCTCLPASCFVHSFYGANFWCS